MWFDKDELRQVKDAMDPDLNWMDFEIWKEAKKFQPGNSEISCPHCQLPLVTLNYAQTNVEVDYFPSCHGIWLDANELEKLISALEDELLTMSTGEYLRATLEEAREILNGPEPLLSEWKDFATVLRLLQNRLLSATPKLHRLLVSFQQNPINR